MKAKEKQRNKNKERVPVCSLRCMNNVIRVLVVSLFHRLKLSRNNNLANLKLRLKLL